MKSSSTHSQQMANGTMWTALERFSIIGIQLLCTFVLARFLAPADFGLMGMLMVFTLIGNTLSEAGFSQALIREREVSEQTRSTVFWANMLLSLVVYGLLWLAAPLIAQFYHEPLLIDVSRATFLVIPCGAACLIQVTHYTRQLNFRRICLVSLTSSLISCGVAIALAWRYHSVWALVVQNVLVYLLRAILYWVTSHWLPRWQFCWSELRRLLSFSHSLMLSYLIGNLFSNIYTILIGRFYGTTEAGYFTQADRIRVVASNSSTSVIQSVSYPILTSVHHEGGDLKASYRRIILIALLCVGLAMTLVMGVSQDLFELVMGSPAWRLSGQYLLPLGIAGILFPLHSVNENILLVKGKSRTVFWLEVTRRCLMVLLLIGFLRFRIGIFVWSYALYSFLLLFINLRVCGRPIGYSTREQLRDILPLLECFALTFVVAQISNHYLCFATPLLRLAITLTISTAVGLALCSRLSAFRDVITLIRFTAKS